MPWQAGDTREVQGVTFTFTLTGGYDHVRPQWTGWPLAHNVDVIPPMQPSTGPLNYRVDGIRFYASAFERALASAIKWRMHQVARARHTVREFDEAVKATHLHSVVRAAAETFPPKGYPNSGGAT